MITESCYARMRIERLVGGEGAGEEGGVFLRDVKGLWRNLLSHSFRFFWCFIPVDLNSCLILPPTPATSSLSLSVLQLYF